MKNNLKSLIVVIILTLAIIVVGGSILMSSDIYMIKKAEWLKESYLRKYFPPEFKYIAEGVYGFENEKIVNSIETNVFGEIVQNRKKIGVINGQISLKSDKISIYNEGMIEEFTFQSIYKIPDPDTINSYKFVVKTHKAFKNNICFFDEIYPNEKFNSVYLELDNYSTNSMLRYFALGKESSGSFLKMGFRTIVKKDFLPRFETLIFLKSKISDYSLYTVPKYAQAPLEDMYYDINSYKPDGYLYRHVSFWQLFTKP